MAIEPDLVDVLTDDHHELETMLDTLGDANDAGQLAVTIAELVRHIVVEEDYLYPPVRESVPGGDRLAADASADSEHAEWLAKRLEGAVLDEVDRRVLLRDLAEVLQRHVQVTESQMFPALRQALSPGQLRQLAGQAEMAKRTAPTRPHPRAPHTQPWSLIVTPGIGLVDRIRDVMTERPTRPDQR
jgi:Hemerythrin HHE cation binding domain